MILAKKEIHNNLYEARQEGKIMVRKGLEEGITLRYAISIKMLRLGDYISYPLSKASCKISKELTGWARDQNFKLKT